MKQSVGYCSVIYRAAEHGNIEALIKLGIAYLYNEGCKCCKLYCEKMLV